MFRVTLLLALLGVAHCVMWGYHHHDSGPDDDDNDSGPGDHNHGHGFGRSRHGCRGYHGCGPHEHTHNLTWHSEFDRRFERLSAYIIRADRYSKDFCDRYGLRNVQESQGNSVYVLTYTMPHLNPDDIAVKIKHRVLYMFAGQEDNPESAIYVDIRVLPDTLKLDDASWTYGDDQLSIHIPYDTALTLKIMKVCVNVNGDTKYVPKRSPIIYY